MAKQFCFISVAKPELESTLFTAMIFLEQLMKFTPDIEPQTPVITVTIVPTKFGNPTVLFHLLMLCYSEKGIFGADGVQLKNGAYIKEQAPVNPLRKSDA